MARRRCLSGLAQAGSAAWAGEQGVGRDLVATGRAIEPMPAGAALVFREALLPLALGAAAVHLAVAQVVFEEEPTAGAVLGVRPGDVRLATRQRALKDSLTI